MPPVGSSVEARSGDLVITVEVDADQALELAAAIEDGNAHGRPLDRRPAIGRRQRRDGGG